MTGHAGAVALAAAFGLLGLAAASASPDLPPAPTLATVVAREERRPAAAAHRALSGSEDGYISYDDDFWAYDQQGDLSTLWDDYAVEPRTCLVYNGQHSIAYELFGKNHQQCAKRSTGTYLMAAGDFARSYVAQQQVDYGWEGQDYGAPEALDYLECTAVAYNDAYYYAKFGCSSLGGLKIVTYTDEDCTKEISTNVGLYNDIKIQFNVCQACVSWPVEADDDAAAAADVDDNFYAAHGYDSKLCGAASHYGESCGWGCRKQVKKSLTPNNGSGGGDHRHWTGFEKFGLTFWSLAALALTWVVLKQRRLMSREDAIVEEAAMNGVGLKKQHVFPIALGIVGLTLLGMVAVWKRWTWLFLLGTNLGLFAHFVFLRRKARREGHGDGGDGYVKDAGLEIS